MSFTIQGNLVDLHQNSIYPAEITVEGERITAITPNYKLQTTNYIIPGFIDAHVHIESSMLVPSEFARLAVVHGTVATVSDPHEIANVCGMEGVDFMIKNGNKVPFKFNFGAPSCVPATTFETAGAIIDAKDIDELLRREDIVYLSEMMNFPGVLNGDEDVMKKIETAKKFDKPVDGHAPGLRGDAVKKYIDAGISTDHECFTADEALDKLKNGMKILIREGSAAKNFEALAELLNDHSDMMMFCSDDKHPDSLVEGHINDLCARAVEKGIDVFKVLKAACLNPVKHYKLKVGLLRLNDFADFTIVKDLKQFQVIQTYINGQLVAENGKSLINSESEVQSSNAVNHFNCSEKKVEDFIYSLEDVPIQNGMIPVIEALDGQLITNKVLIKAKVENGYLVNDFENDILKIVVVNRYNEAPVAKAFIKNFRLKKGAIASSVAHDSHNIVAVGVDDESLCKAVNLVIQNKGGIAVAPSNSPEGGEPNTQPTLEQETAKISDSMKSEHLQRSEAPPPEGFGEAFILPLPVAGLMSLDDGYEVAEKYSAIDKAAKELGSTLYSPFMTLSFMALLVIPHLKLSDKGLFNGDTFTFVRK